MPTTEFLKFDIKSNLNIQGARKCPPQTATATTNWSTWRRCSKRSALAKATQVCTNIWFWARHMGLWCLHYIFHICLFLPAATLQIQILQMCCTESLFRLLPKIFNIFQWPRLRGIWTRNGIHAEMLSVAVRSSKMQPWPSSPSVRRQRRGWRSSTRSLSLSPTRSTGCLTTFFEYVFHRSMF